MAKVALLFPGQGAQVVGMASGLLARSESARGLFARASEILGYDLAALCVDGPDTELNIQPGRGGCGLESRRVLGVVCGRCVVF